jgi:hypothetical protein
MTDGVAQDRQPVYSLQPLIRSLDDANERLDRILEGFDRVLGPEQVDDDA